MSDQPAVSIIIPCRNEEPFIDRCLESVFGFEPVPGGFEVLVVDGQSQDATRAILERWQARQPALRVLDNPARIVPVAMNIGIRAARGTWIVRLDAHAEYPPDYLRLCIATSQRTGAANVGGVMVTLPRGDGRQARLVQALTTHRFGIGNAGFRLGGPEGLADTVPYGCFPRALFAQLGPYDERLVRNQDYELNRRLIHSGGRIWRNPAIRVKYYNQKTIGGLLRQALFTGQWNPWTWYVAPHSFAPRHAIPGAFVLGLGLTLGWATRGALGRAMLALVMLPYLAVASLAAVQQARRYGWWMAPLLPGLFFAYHLAYGAGILRGLALLAAGRTPVQRVREPWPGYGRYRVQCTPLDPVVICSDQPARIQQVTR